MHNLLEGIVCNVKHLNNCYHAKVRNNKNLITSMNLRFIYNSDAIHSDYLFYILM